MKINDVVKEDISRRGFLKGAGAAAVAGAAGKAGAGQFTSSDDLNKNPESIEKVWKPRIAELQARCISILNSFKSVASSVNPEWVPILDQVKLEITLGDASAKSGRAQGQTQTSTFTPTASRVTDWNDIKRKNPNNYAVEIWSKIYPNISYDGPVTGTPAPTIAIQIRPDGAVVDSKLLSPSAEKEWDQAVLDGISKTKIIPLPKIPAGKKLSNPHTMKVNFPLGWFSFTNKATGPAVTTKKSTYKILLEVTVFWDAPDSTLAWILGHEVGHLVNNHPGNVSMAQRRQFELEADEVGAVLAQKIGYDRANFFQWLYNAKVENLKMSDPDPSHPEPIDRVNNLKRKTGFELAAVKYIDSMIQQFQNGLAESVNQGLAEGMAQDEAEEYSGWRAEFVNEINYNTFEVKMTNTRSKESANFIVRPVDMISIGPTLQIETMDVHDLQTGQTASWTSDDPLPDGGIVYAIAMMFWDNKELQKKLWTIVDQSKDQDMMPGLDQRRSIGQEVDADAYIDSQEKTQDAMAKMKQGMAEDDVDEGFRVANQQIPGTKNRAKSAYYPTNVKPKVPKLDKPLTDQELARLTQLAGIKSK